MKKINIIFMMIFFLGLVSCYKEDKPEGSSVLTQENSSHTMLDTWIVDNYNKPYNINVSYKWRKESTFDKDVLFPPKKQNVKIVLGVAQKLWLDIFEHYMGDNIKNSLPIEIKLFGGKSEQRPTYEDLSIKGGSPYQMTLFRVDEFQKDRQHVDKLMHNIYNNYVKLLVWKKPFDRETFQKLNLYPYKQDFDITNDSNIYTDMVRIFDSGFYSHIAFWNGVDDDFAETAAILLTHTEKEIDVLIDSATNVDGLIKYDDINRKKKVKKVLEAKREFVIQYFKSEYDIDFRKLNYSVLKARQEYLK